MKYLLITLLIYFAIGCSNNSQPNNLLQPTEDTSNFFSVTNYIKQQLSEFKQHHLQPKRFVTINNHTDSALIAADSVEKAVAEFLTPVIDSANLKHLFKEDKFNDLSTNAYTFTYSPKAALPNNFELQQWIIYFDQTINAIRRVYLVKNKPPTTTLQLTWQSNKWCSLVYIDLTGKESKVIKTEKIIWNQ